MQWKPAATLGLVPVAALIAPAAPEVAVVSEISWPLRPRPLGVALTVTGRWSGLVSFQWALPTAALTQNPARTR